MSEALLPESPQDRMHNTLIAVMLAVALDPEASECRRSALEIKPKNVLG